MKRFYCIPLVAFLLLALLCPLASMPASADGERVFPYPSELGRALLYEEFATGMEALNAGYPDLVELQWIGNGTIGKPIPALIVTDELSPVPMDERVTVLLVSYQHGDEPVGREAVPRFLEDLLAEADAGGWGFFRAGVLAVVPALNTDGFILDQRWNGNSSDLNRDYPTGDLLPEGEEPLDQPETRALVDFLGSLDRIDLAADLHGMLGFPSDVAFLIPMRSTDLSRGHLTLEMGRSMGESLEAAGRTWYMGEVEEMLEYGSSGALGDYLSEQGIVELDIEVAGGKERAFDAERYDCWIGTVDAALRGLLDFASTRRGIAMRLEQESALTLAPGAASWELEAFTDLFDDASIAGGNGDIPIQHSTTLVTESSYAQSSSSGGLEALATKLARALDAGSRVVLLDSGMELMGSLLNITISHSESSLPLVTLTQDGRSVLGGLPFPIEQHPWPVVTTHLPPLGLEGVNCSLAGADGIEDAGGTVWASLDGLAFAGEMPARNGTVGFISLALPRPAGGPNEAGIAYHSSALTWCGKGMLCSAAGLDSWQMLEAQAPLLVGNGSVVSVRLSSSAAGSGNISMTSEAVELDDSSSSGPLPLSSTFSVLGPASENRIALAVAGSVGGETMELDLSLVSLDWEAADGHDDGPDWILIAGAAVLVGTAVVVALALGIKKRGRK